MFRWVELLDCYAIFTDCEVTDINDSQFSLADDARASSHAWFFFVRFFRLCSLLANPISHCGPLYHTRCSHWRLKLQLKLPGDQAFHLFRLAKHFAPCNGIREIFSWGIQVPLTVPQCGVRRVESRISLRSPTSGESDIACAQKCPHRWSVIQAIVFYPEGHILSLNWINPQTPFQSRHSFTVKSFAVKLSDIFLSIQTCYFCCCGNYWLSVVCLAASVV